MSQNDAPDEHHHLPLWTFFFTLLAMTVGEVGLYEYWRHTGGTLMPKFAIVLVVLALTLPKAAVVMIWFMHLRYEKPIIVTLAVVPLSLIAIGILPNIYDSLVNKETMVAESPVITGFGPRTTLPGEKHHDDHHASHASHDHPADHDDHKAHQSHVSDEKHAAQKHDDPKEDNKHSDNSHKASENQKHE